MTAPLPQSITLMTEDEIRRHYTGEDAGCGCLSSPLGHLPLREMTIDARVIATFAATTLRQTFVNTLGQPLEATYIFPLPDRAAVTRFVMEVNGRRVEGDIQERRQARQTYDRAIASGQRASIAEEERPGVFTIRVGNLMPGEAASITLELTGPLPVADGEVTYRFPLVVAPRYIPGHALGGENVGDGTANDTSAVPDASRITPPVLLPGFPNPVRLGISVDLDPAGLPLSHVRSSLHAAYADSTQRGLRVSLAEGQRLDRDFVLRFRLDDAHARSSLRVLQGQRGEDTFMLTVVPPNTAVRKPKDVVFVLDKSGSMGGWKMVAARRAVARMVDALGADDRFHVIAFDSGMQSCPITAHGLVEATDRNRFRSVEWITRIEAAGGTEMANPLSHAANLLGGGYLDRDRALVFVTDGQVGNEAQLIQLLGDRLRGTRVFAVGIDKAVNEAFLNRLAALGRSSHAELIENEQRLDESLQRIHRRVESPVVSELSIELLGAQPVQDTTAPSRLPDLFMGVPVTIFGRLRGNGAVPTVVVRGRTADNRAFEERVGGQSTMNTSLEPAWARTHLRDLEDRFDIGKENKGELERRIVGVSIGARVLCRFTAFVAVDHEVVNRGGWNQKLTQAVDQPAGWGQHEAEAGLSEGSTRTRAGTLKGHGMPDAKRSGARAERPAARMAPARSASPAEEKAPRPASPAPSFRAKSVDLDLSASADDALFESDAASPAPPAAAFAGRSAGPTIAGGLLDKAKEAVSGFFGGKKDEAGPPTLQARLADVLAVLRRRGEVFGTAKEVVELLRLMLEELAHAGAPAQDREPFQLTMRALRSAIDAHDLARADEELRKLELFCEQRLGATPPAAATGTGGRRDFWR